MANIYQISQSFQAIFDELEENGGELTPELEEALSITQDEFKSKIKSYSEVIANLSADVLAIKAEKDRLSALQKSKEGTIERLKSIMAKAIDQFGDTTKTGGKFVDYGTGKISVKTSKVVEFNNDWINRFVNRYLAGLQWYHMQNQLSKSFVNQETLIDYANTTTSDEEDNDVSVVPFKDEDLKFLNAKINLNVSLADLLSTEEGFNLAKVLVEYSDAKIEGSVDKTEIKRVAKETNITPIYANIVDSKTVTIK